MNLEVIHIAADKIEKRSDLAKGILEMMGYDNMVIPKQSFNDDDWYEYNPVSKELVREYSCKMPKPQPRAGFEVSRGMSAKYLGLWRLPA